MSNFKCKIKIKATGEIVEAEALDDYFGKHRYGYRTIVDLERFGLSPKHITLTEDEVKLINE